LPEVTLSQSEIPSGSGLTRALCLLTIALILAAVVYSLWIAVRYWSQISV
jgi:uncharacterized protein HemX